MTLMIKKRILAMFLALSLLPALIACQKAQPEEEKSASSSPLFNISAPADKGQCAAFFALSQGFVYFTETQDGYHAGFVDIQNSISCDHILAGTGKIDFSTVRVFETEKNRAVICAGGKTFLSVLDENASQEFAVPEGVDLSGALFYDSCAFIYPDTASKLLLLSPYDFSAQYVLCDTALLQDFGGLITIEPGENKIYYALKNSEGFYGVASFEYGSNQTLDITLFPFDSFQEVSSGKVIFHQDETDGESYSFFDFSAGRKTDFSVKKHYYGYAASGDGKYFIGIDAPDSESGGFIDILRVSSGTRLARYSCGVWVCNSDLALSPDGKIILFSLFEAGQAMGDEIISYIDLEKFLAE